MTDVELMMENGMLKVLYFCEDCPKSVECDKRFSPCCDNFLGYKLTLEDKTRGDRIDMKIESEKSYERYRNS